MSRSPEEIRAAYAQGRPIRDDEQHMLDIGRKCGKEDCSTVDYLTVECPHCKERFCDEHYRPDTHSCKEWDPEAGNRKIVECPLCFEAISARPGQDLSERIDAHIERECSSTTGKAEKKSTLPTCSRVRCDKTLWVPFACENCRQNFCAIHRNMHDCKSKVVTPNSQPGPLQSFSSEASARSAAAMAAIRRSAASAFASAQSITTSNSRASQSQAKQNVVELGKSLSSKLKIGGSSPNERARNELKSRIKAMEERERKGLLSESEKEKLTELKGASSGDKECIIS